MQIVTSDKIVSGHEVFKLVDTHGLPLDIIVLELRDRGLGFNVHEFIDSALLAKWTPKRIKWTLKVNCENNGVVNLVNKYVDQKTKAT